MTVAHTRNLRVVLIWQSWAQSGLASASEESWLKKKSQFVQGQVFNLWILCIGHSAQLGCTGKPCVLCRIGSWFGTKPISSSQLDVDWKSWMIWWTYPGWKTICFVQNRVVIRHKMVVLSDGPICAKSRLHNIHTQVWWFSTKPINLVVSFRRPCQGCRQRNGYLAGHRRVNQRQLRLRRVVQTNRYLFHPMLSWCPISRYLMNGWNSTAFVCICGN